MEECLPFLRNNIKHGRFDQTAKPLILIFNFIVGLATVQTEFDRDVTKTYPVADFIAKLRRLADALETGTAFEIQVQSERIYIPKHAKCSIEHERHESSEELEFQITWTRD